MRSAVLIFSIGFLVLIVNAGDWLAEKLVLRKDDSFLENSLSILIEREMADKEIPGLAISVIDDQNILFENGFGFADPVNNVEATEYSVFQAGAVAQLLTTIAILQRVEHGKLDLDAPISAYLPNFAPNNPFGLELTLRQILSHQSGLVTEPPIGHYYDASGPDLAAIVASLNHTTVVFPPETFTKYSNAGFAVAGHVLETSLEKPFEQHMRAILDRMHLKRTSFTPRLDLRSKLATGHTTTLDDRILPQSSFQVPNGPANNLYTTVNDLGAFLRVLFADGLSPNGSILDADAFEQMWTIQLSTARKEIPFGLGFAISIFNNERRATITSNTHGFSVRIDLLPDRDLGVAIIANLEHTDAVIEKIASYALSIALAQKLEAPTPSFPGTQVPDSNMVARSVGYYVNDTPLHIQQSDRELYLYQDFNRFRLRQKGDSLIIDDRHTFGPILISDGLTLVYKDALYSKRNMAVPQPGQSVYSAYEGEYGFPENPMTVIEKRNRLFLLDSWNAVYQLQPETNDVFALPVDGLYGGEKIVFQRDSTGNVVTAVLANMPLARLDNSVHRRSYATIPLETTLDALPTNSTLPAAVTDLPGSKSSELIDLSMVDPLFNVDMRYATPNNLLRTQLYPEARPLLQKPVAEAIFKIQRQIRRIGYEFVIYDTYRPWYISERIWTNTPDSLKHFFNHPYEQICQNNGTAVSIGLYALETGEALEMPTAVDVMATEAYTDSPLPAEQLRWNRDFLRRLMESEGFAASADKWWHFTHRSCSDYAVMNEPADKVSFITGTELQRIFTVER